MLPQLANTYNPSKTYPNSQWLASAKLDGVRCLYLPNKGLTSRSLKLRYVGFEIIEQACKLMCDTNNLSFLDGELYIRDEKFDVISGIVRSMNNIDRAAKARVEFHIFAFGSNSEPAMPADRMVALLAEMMIDCANIIWVYQKLIPNTPTAVQAESELVKSSGRSNEGIMLRNPSSVYAGVRSNNLLKVKNFVKSTFVIVGFTKGTGKYANSLGNLLIRGMPDQVVVNSKVGTGFSDLQRSNIWTNQSNYLGKDIEVIYLGVTPGGSLRHPVFSQFV